MVTVRQGHPSQQQVHRAAGGLQMDDVNSIVRMLETNAAPTVAVLQSASEALRQQTSPRPPAVVAARWRVAVLLEKLGG
ncbi:hypothetical protein [Geodermatophilus sp. SYSU D00815]